MIIIRIFIIIIYYYEQLIKKVLLRPLYKITGACRQCGKCCQLIGIYDPQNIARRSWTRKLLIFFYEKVNHFQFVEHDSQHKLLAFTCQKLDKKTGRCTSYRWRPAACRNYPMVRYFEKPEIITGCGFKAELRRGERISNMVMHLHVTCLCILQNNLQLT